MGSIDPLPAGRVNIQNYHRWLRILTLVHFSGKEICLYIFHKKEGYPEDGVELYKRLDRTNRKHFENLLNNKKEKFYVENFNLIFPSIGITDTSAFDLPLFVFFIDHVLKNPIYRILKQLRKRRNVIFHRARSLEEDEFNKLWDEIINELIDDFSDYFDVERVGNLKEGPLDDYHYYQLKAYNAYLKYCQEEQKKQIDELEKNFVGHTEEFKRQCIKIDAQFKDIYCVVDIEKELHEVHLRFLACERHSREIIWKVLRYVLYEETSVETIDDIKDIFSKIVVFYQNNRLRYDRLDRNCRDLIGGDFKNLHLSKKDNHFTNSILEEIDFENHLSGITNDVNFVRHFRTLVSHASKSTFREIKECQYLYDQPLWYNGNECTDWKTALTNLSQALANILAFLFEKNVNGFKFVRTRDDSTIKADEVNRILTSSGTDLKVEISHQLLYHDWQVEKWQGRYEESKTNEFFCTFKLEVVGYDPNFFEDLTDFDVKICEKMKASFEYQLQRRFNNFEKWEVDLQIDSFLLNDGNNEGVIDCEVVCKSYKGERSFENYAVKSSQQSRALWNEITESIEFSAQEYNGLSVKVSRALKWKIGSIIIKFQIKKLNGKWIYEDLENLRRTVKTSLFKVFESYEVSVDIMVGNTTTTAAAVDEKNVYACTMLFSTQDRKMCSEIQQFMNEIEFKDLEYNGKSFTGGFSTDHLSLTEPKRSKRQTSMKLRVEYIDGKPSVFVDNTLIDKNGIKKNEKILKSRGWNCEIKKDKSNKRHWLKLKQGENEDLISIFLYHGKIEVQLMKCSLSNLLQLTIEAPNLILSQQGYIEEVRNSTSCGRTKLELISYGDFHILGRIVVKSLSLKALSSEKSGQLLSNIVVLAEIKIKCATLNAYAHQLEVNGCIQSYQNELRLEVESGNLTITAKGEIGNYSDLISETCRLYINVKYGVLENLGRIYARDYLELYCHLMRGVSDSRDSSHHLHNRKHQEQPVKSESSQEKYPQYCRKRSKTTSVPFCSVSSMTSSEDDMDSMLSSMISSKSEIYEVDVFDNTSFVGSSAKHITDIVDIEDLLEKEMKRNLSPEALDLASNSDREKEETGKIEKKMLERRNSFPRMAKKNSIKGEMESNKKIMNKEKSWHGNIQAYYIQCTISGDVRDCSQFQAKILNFDVKGSVVVRREWLWVCGILQGIIRGTFVFQNRKTFLVGIDRLKVSRDFVLRDYQKTKKENHPKLETKKNTFLQIGTTFINNGNFVSHGALHIETGSIRQTSHSEVWCEKDLLISFHTEVIDGNWKGNVNSEQNLFLQMDSRVICDAECKAKEIHCGFYGINAQLVVTQSVEVSEGSLYLDTFDRPVDENPDRNKSNLVIFGDKGRLEAKGIIGIRSTMSVEDNAKIILGKNDCNDPTEVSLSQLNIGNGAILELKGDVNKNAQSFIVSDEGIERNPNLSCHAVLCKDMMRVEETCRIQYNGYLQIFATKVLCDGEISPDVSPSGLWICCKEEFVNNGTIIADSINIQVDHLINDNGTISAQSEVNIELTTITSCIVAGHVYVKDACTVTSRSNEVVAFSAVGGQLDSNSSESCFVTPTSFLVISNRGSVTITSNIVQLEGEQQKCIFYLNNHLVFENHCSFYQVFTYYPEVTGEKNKSSKITINGLFTARKMYINKVNDSNESKAICDTENTDIDDQTDEVRDNDQTDEIKYHGQTDESRNDSRTEKEQLDQAKRDGQTDESRNEGQTERAEFDGETDEAKSDGEADKGKYGGQINDARSNSRRNVAFEGSSSNITVTNLTIGKSIYEALFDVKDFMLVETLNLQCEIGTVRSTIRSFDSKAISLKINGKFDLVGQEQEGKLASIIVQEDLKITGGLYTYGSCVVKASRSIHASKCSSIFISKSLELSTQKSGSIILEEGNIWSTDVNTSFVVLSGYVLLSSKINHIDTLNISAYYNVTVTGEVSSCKNVNVIGETLDLGDKESCVEKHNFQHCSQLNIAGTMVIVIRGKFVNIENIVIESTGTVKQTKDSIFKDIDSMVMNGKNIFLYGSFDPSKKHGYVFSTPNEPSIQLYAKKMILGKQCKIIHYKTAQIKAGILSMYGVIKTDLLNVLTTHECRIKGVVQTRYQGSIFGNTIEVGGKYVGYRKYRPALKIVGANIVIFGNLRKISRLEIDGSDRVKVARSSFMLRVDLLEIKGKYINVSGQIRGTEGSNSFVVQLKGKNIILDKKCSIRYFKLITFNAKSISMDGLIEGNPFCGVCLDGEVERNLVSKAFFACLYFDGFGMISAVDYLQIHGTNCINLLGKSLIRNFREVVIVSENININGEMNSLADPTKTLTMVSIFGLNVAACGILHSINSIKIVSLEKLLLKDVNLFNNLEIIGTNIEMTGVVHLGRNIQIFCNKFQLAGTVGSVTLFKILCKENVFFLGTSDVRYLQNLQIYADTISMAGSMEGRLHSILLENTCSVNIFGRRVSLSKNISNVSNIHVSSLQAIFCNSKSKIDFCKAIDLFSEGVKLDGTIQNEDLSSSQLKVISETMELTQLVSGLCKIDLEAVKVIETTDTSDIMFSNNIQIRSQILNISGCIRTTQENQVEVQSGSHDFRKTSLVLIGKEINIHGNIKNVCLLDIQSEEVSRLASSGRIYFDDVYPAKVMINSRSIKLGGYIYGITELDVTAKEVVIESNIISCGNVSIISNSVDALSGTINGSMFEDSMGGMEHNVNIQCSDYVRLSGSYTNLANVKIIAENNLTLTETCQIENCQLVQLLNNMKTDMKGLGVKNKDVVVKNKQMKANNEISMTLEKGSELLYCDRIGMVGRCVNLHGLITFIRYVEISSQFLKMTDHLQLNTFMAESQSIELEGTLEGINNDQSPKSLSQLNMIADGELLLYENSVVTSFEKIKLQGENIWFCGKIEGLKEDYLSTINIEAEALEILRGQFVGPLKSVDINSKHIHTDDHAMFNLCKGLNIKALCLSISAQIIGFCESSSMSITAQVIEISGEVKHFSDMTVKTYDFSIPLDVMKKYCREKDVAKIESLCTNVEFSGKIENVSSLNIVSPHEVVFLHDFIIKTFNHLVVKAGRIKSDGIITGGSSNTNENKVELKSSISLTLNNLIREISKVELNAGKELMLNENNKIVSCGHIEMNSEWVTNLGKIESFQQLILRPWALLNSGDIIASDEKACLQIFCDILLVNTGTIITSDSVYQSPFIISMATGKRCCLITEQGRTVLDSMICILGDNSVSTGDLTNETTLLLEFSSLKTVEDPGAKEIKNWERTLLPLRDEKTNWVNFIKENQDKQFWKCLDLYQTLILLSKEKYLMFSKMQTFVMAINKQGIHSFDDTSFKEFVDIVCEGKHMVILEKWKLKEITLKILPAARTIRNKIHEGWISFDASLREKLSHVLPGITSTTKQRITAKTIAKSKRFLGDDLFYETIVNGNEDEIIDQTKFNEFLEKVLFYSEGILRGQDVSMIYLKKNSPTFSLHAGMVNRKGKTRIAIPLYQEYRRMEIKDILDQRCHVMEPKYQRGMDNIDDNYDVVEYEELKPQPGMDKISDDFEVVELDLLDQRKGIEHEGLQPPKILDKVLATKIGVKSKIDSDQIFEVKLNDKAPPIVNPVLPEVKYAAQSKYQPANQIFSDNKFVASNLLDRRKCMEREELQRPSVLNKVLDAGIQGKSRTDSIDEMYNMVLEEKNSHQKINIKNVVEQSKTKQVQKRKGDSSQVEKSDSFEERMQQIEKNVSEVKQKKRTIPKWMKRAYKNMRGKSDERSKPQNKKPGLLTTLKNKVKFKVKSIIDLIFKSKEANVTTSTIELNPDILRVYKNYKCYQFLHMADVQTALRICDTYHLTIDQRMMLEDRIVSQCFNLLKKPTKPRRKQNVDRRNKIYYKYLFEYEILEFIRGGLISKKQKQAMLLYLNVYPRPSAMQQDRHSLTAKEIYQCKTISLMKRHLLEADFSLYQTDFYNKLKICDKFGLEVPMEVMMSGEKLVSTKIDHKNDFSLYRKQELHIFKGNQNDGLLVPSNLRFMLQISPQTFLSKRDKKMIVAALTQGNLDVPLKPKSCQVDYKFYREDLKQFKYEKEKEYRGNIEKEFQRRMNNSFRYHHDFRAKIQGTFENFQTINEIDGGNIDGWMKNDLALCDRLDLWVEDEEILRRNKKLGFEKKKNSNKTSSFSKIYFPKYFYLESVKPGLGWLNLTIPSKPHRLLSHVELARSFKNSTEFKKFMTYILKNNCLNDFKIVFKNALRKEQTDLNEICHLLKELAKYLERLNLYDEFLEQLDSTKPQTSRQTIKKKKSLRPLLKELVKFFKKLYLLKDLAKYFENYNKITEVSGRKKNAIIIKMCIEKCKFYGDILFMSEQSKHSKTLHEKLNDKYDDVYSLRSMATELHNINGAMEEKHIYKKMNRFDELGLDLPTKDLEQVIALSCVDETEETLTESEIRSISKKTSDLFSTKQTENSNTITTTDNKAKSEEDFSSAEDANVGTIGREEQNRIVEFREYFESGLEKYDLATLNALDTVCKKYIRKFNEEVYCFDNNRDSFKVKPIIIQLKETSKLLYEKGVYDNLRNADKWGLITPDTKIIKASLVEWSIESEVDWNVKSYKEKREVLMGKMHSFDKELKSQLLKIDDARKAIAAIKAFPMEATKITEMESKTENQEIVQDIAESLSHSTQKKFLKQLRHEQIKIMKEVFLPMNEKVKKQMKVLIDMLESIKINTMVDNEELVMVCSNNVHRLLGWEYNKITTEPQQSFEENCKKLDNAIMNRRRIDPNYVSSTRLDEYCKQKEEIKRLMAPYNIIAAVKSPLSATSPRRLVVPTFPVGFSSYIEFPIPNKFVQSSSVVYSEKR